VRLADRNFRKQKTFYNPYIKTAYIKEDYMVFVPEQTAELMTGQTTGKSTLLRHGISWVSEKFGDNLEWLIIAETEKPCI